MGLRSLEQFWCHAYKSLFRIDFHQFVRPAIACFVKKIDIRESAQMEKDLNQAWVGS